MDFTGSHVMSVCLTIALIFIGGSAGQAINKTSDSSTAEYNYQPTNETFTYDYQQTNGTFKNVTYNYQQTNQTVLFGNGTGGVSFSCNSTADNPIDWWFTRCNSATFIMYAGTVQVVPSAWNLNVTGNLSTISIDLLSVNDGGTYTCVSRNAGPGATARAFALTVMSQKYTFTSSDLPLTVLENTKLSMAYRYFFSGITTPLCQCDLAGQVLPCNVVHEKPCVSLYASVTFNTTRNLNGKDLVCSLSSPQSGLLVTDTFPLNIEYPPTATCGSNSTTRDCRCTADSNPNSAVHWRDSQGQIQVIGPFSNANLTASMNLTCEAMNILNGSPVTSNCQCA